MFILNTAGKNCNTGNSCKIQEKTKPVRISDRQDKLPSVGRFQSGNMKKIKENEPCNSPASVNLIHNHKSRERENPANKQSVTRMQQPAKVNTFYDMSVPSVTIRNMPSAVKTSKQAMTPPMPIHGKSSTSISYNQSFIKSSDYHIKTSQLSAPSNHQKDKIKKSSVQSQDAATSTFAKRPMFPPDLAPERIKHGQPTRVPTPVQPVFSPDLAPERMKHGQSESVQAVAVAYRPAPAPPQSSTVAKNISNKSQSNQVASRGKLSKQPMFPTNLSSKTPTSNCGTGQTRASSSSVRNLKNKFEERET